MKQCDATHSVAVKRHSLGQPIFPACVLPADHPGPHVAHESFGGFEWQRPSKSSAADQLRNAYATGNPELIDRAMENCASAASQ